MEAPRAHYVTTVDGVNVAYGTFGAGPPLLIPNAGQLSGPI